MVRNRSITTRLWGEIFDWMLLQAGCFDCQVELIWRAGPRKAKEKCATIYNHQLLQQIQR